MGSFLSCVILIDSLLSIHPNSKNMYLLKNTINFFTDSPKMISSNIKIIIRIVINNFIKHSSNFSLKFLIKGLFRNLEAVTLVLALNCNLNNYSVFKLDSFYINISIINSFSSYRYNLNYSITLYLSAIRVALLRFFKATFKTFF